MKRNTRPKICYLHGVQDPNETPFDYERHVLCVVCQVKLWELAQHEVSFDMRNQTVTVTATAIDDSDEDNTA